MHYRCFSFLILIRAILFVCAFFKDSSPVVGKVLIAVNHTLPELSLVAINYRAHVLHGGVAYDWGQISFQVREIENWGKTHRKRDKIDNFRGSVCTKGS